MNSNNSISCIKEKYIPVLDHGFISVVDYMGNDSAVAQAARCSYGKGTKKISDDKRLIRTLMREGHTSPFEMCSIKFHMSMPIFVMRQLIRHRVAKINETSGRYSILSTDYYLPLHKRHTKQDKLNKQGGSEELIEKSEYEKIYKTRKKIRGEISDFYNMCLDAGVSREMARIDLPVSTYTSCYWKMDLRNLLHFLKLRLDKHAQWEIRQYARVIGGIVKLWCPLTWDAFENYVLNGVYISEEEAEIFCRLAGTFRIEDHEGVMNTCFDEMDMSARERKAFKEKYNKLILRKKMYKYDNIIIPE